MSSKSSKQQRENWWNYLISEGMRPHGMTFKRLERIRDEVIADDNFWFHVIDRFGGLHDMFGDSFYRRYKSAASEQSRGNFWSMIRERLF